MLVETGSQELYPPTPMFGHAAVTQDHPGSGRGNHEPRGPSGTDIMTYSQYVNGSIFTIPKQWSQQSTDDLLVTVYSFIKTYLGASGAGQGSIDHRIEQAMDLVKSHLMTAVRSEVEELRDKITKLEDTVNHLSRENEVLRSNVTPELTKLEDTVSHLSRENEVLRANVNPDVLASLLGNRSILGGLPPDPNNHPALQPPNQH